MLKKLGKLLKYEFRYYFRLLPAVYLMLAFLALPAGYQMKQSAASGVLLTAIWGILMTAMIVMSIVLIIQRFISNFLRNPGSLMFTLPVTSYALTASKAIAALCIALLSIIIVSVSGIIYAIGIESLSSTHFKIELSPIEGVVYIIDCIIMILQQVCLIYTAICISHLLPRFRFAAGAILYFAIMYFLEQPVFRFILSSTGSSFLPNSLSQAITFGITGLIFGTLFFFTTGFLLKRRLNLE